MSEMVERVALAIYVAEIGGPEGWNHPRVEAGKERWFAKARAAIEAMREPTPEIIRAHHVVPDDTNFDERAADNWRNLIDALHSEKVSGAA